MPRFGYRKPVLDRLIPKTTVTPAGCFHVARKKATMNTPTRVVAALAVAAALTLTACSTDSPADAYRACVVELTDDTAQALDDALDIIDAGHAADLDTTKVRDVVETVRSADEICAGAR